jgi:TonB-dependent receptor
MMVSTIAHAQGQPAAAAQTDVATEQATATPDPVADRELVVTGIRSSLEKAAAIKRASLEVVDSIVAEDIGKFPDPTTAGALQRVPGVQVTVGSNNEITGVLVRGLSDISSNLDGREIFSTTGRGFAFQDLPAAALARVDVKKTSSADLIEGGIASTVDLQLNKPFNFNKPAIVATARANYENNTGKAEPQFSLLATKTWDTDLGRIGVLLAGSYANFVYDRPITFGGLRRTMAGAPFNLSGINAPLNFGAVNTYGQYDRPEANGSIQWEVSPHWQIYADGLFTGYESDNQASYQAVPFFSSGTTVSNVVTNPNQCFSARVSSAQTEPNAQQIASGAFTVQNLCNLVSASFNNATLNSSMQSFRDRYYNYLGAVGFKYDDGDTQLHFDTAYQKSTGRHEAFIVDTEKRISLNLQTNVNGGVVVSEPGNPGGDPNGWSFWHGLSQDFQKSNGSLVQSRLDGSHDLHNALGFLQKLEFGVRFAKRVALYQEANVSTPAPGGDFATLVTGNTPAGFMTQIPGVSRVNDGATEVGPNPDYLRSAAGRDQIRVLYGLAPGDPAYQPERQFHASEQTYAGYVQTNYKVEMGGPIRVDGVVGLRVVRTDRTISGAGLVGTVAVPQTVGTADTKFLPNASARLELGGGLQARATYARTMERPDFASLNPGLNYIVSTNPSVINSGSAGNPNLKAQVSDSYDATLEYYWHNGFVAAAGFYRSIQNRVVSQAQTEEIAGQVYNISRPRNVGEVSLKGLEISGQTFFDFLPGPLAGFGAFGNFTYVDSKIGGSDPLAGYPVLGVSKYNFNAGLLYDKFGISGRLVYTYRSKYYESDATGTNTLRAIDPSQASNVNYKATVLDYVRAGGRLDFSLGYDINKAVRVDVGGSNILHNKYRSYYNQTWMPVDYRDDGTTYTIGVRMKI